MEPCACLLVLLVVTGSLARHVEVQRPRLRLRHGPDKELVLENDLEPMNEEEDGLVVRKRCSCYCRKKYRRDEWGCCPCGWTDEVCFPGDVFLALEDGSQTEMKDLRAGDKVQTVSSEGMVRYSEVRTFLKRQPMKHALYLNISTTTGASLSLSGRHLVFVSNSNETNSMEPRFALTVRPGEYFFIRGGCGQSLCPVMVTHVEPVVKQGVYVPLTEEGTLLVNNVFASCYSSINHHIAHVFTAPFRRFPWLLSAWQEDGFSPLVNGLKQLGHVILPNYLQFHEVEDSVLPQIRIDL